jgi:hypothetical protein
MGSDYNIARDVAFLSFIVPTLRRPDPRRGSVAEHPGLVTANSGENTASARSARATAAR